METTTTSVIRTVDGRTVPAPGRYTLDPTHTRADFEARHLMITKVRGGFESLSGGFEVGDEPGLSSVEVVIDAASISTRTGDRDAHLRSPDFLDVERYPSITFRSTSVEPAGDRWRLAGELTIREVTKPVVLDMAFGGATADPWGNTRLLFTASTEIDREEWGLTWNVALEGGGVLVSKRIKIDIEAQALPA